MDINDTSVKEGMSNYESLAELFVDQETKEFLSKWKTGNEVHKMKEFKTSTLTDKEYIAMKEVFSVLKTEKDDYDKYKKAFNKLCKFCNIVPNGTIITKYELSKGKEDDSNNLYVEYTENTRPITMPPDTKLYHQSVVGGIKELIPRWKLRGKSQNGYLCDKPRIYLTMSKKLPKISTDNKLSDKMHIYEVLTTPDKVFVDPLLPDVFQKAVYVETDKPIPVKEITPDTITDKIKNLVSPKKEGYDMTIGTGISESARSEEKTKMRKDLSDLEFSYDKKYNAFCLTVSSYSAEKLKNTLAKKQAELDAAKKEKKNATNRYDRLSAQIKIDHLENICKKCNDMIKKKESYNSNESK